MSFVHVRFFFAPASSCPANRFTPCVALELPAWAAIFAVTSARVSLPGPNTVVERGATGSSKKSRKTTIRIEA